MQNWVRRIQKEWKLLEKDLPSKVVCRNFRSVNLQKQSNLKLKVVDGVFSNEEIKAGRFVIEYCGEVISCKEAKLRSHAYEIHGVKDAFIISLNASESIDASRKGSIARFINHSCQPDCETRKWNVLGK